MILFFKEISAGILYFSLIFFNFYFLTCKVIISKVHDLTKMISSQNEDFVAINARVTKLTYQKMQEVSKCLDVSLSSLIASSVNEYLHQVTSDKGLQTVELEVARFAYSKKKSSNQ